VSQICNLICLLSMVIMRAPNSTPEVHHAHAHTHMSLSAWPRCAATPIPCIAGANPLSLPSPLPPLPLAPKPTDGEVVHRLEPLVRKLEE
jgi:hypothetical protein